MLATIVMLFCMGGNFAMMPAQTMRVWGEPRSPNPKFG